MQSVCTNELVQKIAQQQPLVVNLTNSVTINWTTNVLLSIGASPIVSHAKDELEELIVQCDSIVINMGTLNNKWIDLANFAQRCAHANKKPIIFDPVGVGATTLRTNFAHHFIANGVSIIRANASEIAHLTGLQFNGVGVDARVSNESLAEPTHRLSQKTQSIIISTSSFDLISSPEQLVHSTINVPIMHKITGMGCALSSFIGAFATVTTDYFSAAVNAVEVYNSAGLQVSQDCNGPGLFQPLFLDHLSSLATN